GIRAQPAGKSRSFRSLFLMPRRRRSGHATNAVSGGLPDVLASLECQFETSGLLAADSVAARIPNPLSGRTNHHTPLTNLRLDIFHYGNTIEACHVHVLQPMYSTPSPSPAGARLSRCLRGAGPWLLELWSLHWGSHSRPSRSTWAC